MHHSTPWCGTDTATCASGAGCVHPGYLGENRLSDGLKAMGELCNQSEKFRQADTFRSVGMRDAMKSHRTYTVGGSKQKCGIEKYEKIMNTVCQN